MRFRRQTRPDAVGDADDWLMTYADMITLLLCFFAIFLSVSLPKKDAAHKAAAAVSAPAPPPRPIVVVETRVRLPEREPVSLPAEDVADAPRVAIEARPAAPATPRSVPETIAANDAPRQAATLPPPGPIADEQTGDRITIIELNSAAFFDRGSASLSGAGQSILSDVAVTLRSDKYAGYLATVEGHTDDTPMNTPQFPSNWELSTARAAAVVRALLDQGVAAAKLRAVGYADTFPKLANRGPDGTAIAENQAQNRRVVIALEKIEKAARPPATSARNEPRPVGQGAAAMTIIPPY